jgi:hypothetical protein
LAEWLLFFIFISELEKICWMAAAILHQQYGFGQGVCEVAAQTTCPHWKKLPIQTPCVARPLKLNKHQTHAVYNPYSDLEIKSSTGPAALSPSMHPGAATGWGPRILEIARRNFQKVLPNIGLFRGNVELNH